MSVPDVLSVSPTTGCYLSEWNHRGSSPANVRFQVDALTNVNKLKLDIWIPVKKFFCNDPLIKCIMFSKTVVEKDLNTCNLSLWRSLKNLVSSLVLNWKLLTFRINEIELNAASWRQSWVLQQKHHQFKHNVAATRIGRPSGWIEWMCKTLEFYREKNALSQTGFLTFSLRSFFAGLDLQAPAQTHVPYRSFRLLLSTFCGEKYWIVYKISFRIKSQTIE